MAGKIFISYRRDDSAGHAGRVHDRLAAQFGRDLLFMDVDAVPLGSNFVNVITEAVIKCDVLLAVIGPNWLEVKDEDGRRRLDNPSDFVRVEIGTALQRDIPVIPILLDGTRMPTSADLPDDLGDLAKRNGLEVRHTSFHADMDKLIRFLRTRSDTAPSNRTVPGPRDTGVWSNFYLWVTIACLVVVLMMVFYNPKPTITDEERLRKIEQPKSEAELDRELRQAYGKHCVDSGGRVVSVGNGRTCLKPTDTFRDCPECPEMVVVPAGEFMMGSPESERGRNNDEGPQRKVTISKPFAVGKFEVTFAQWDACVAESGCTHKPGDESWGRGRRPVINVSWDDAKQFVAWLAKKTGKPYRLLSEAEWEYAARGLMSTSATYTKFAWGNDIGKNRANCDGCGSQWDNKRTAPVGSFQPNSFGLHDMHGNVWEWVEDCYEDSYDKAAPDGRARLNVASCSPIGRGGSWDNYPEVLRSAGRSKGTSSGRYKTQGFRVARTLD